MSSYGGPQRSGANRGSSGGARGGAARPGGGSTETQPFHSAYNFVPLSGWVLSPDWAAQVSHDLPFSDGISGELEIELLADTPLLVGGEQKKASTDAEGEVHPYRLSDGRYAIPGSSLRGMLRTVIEIAAFGRMGKVDDRRFGLRDLSGKFVKEVYASKMANVCAGWLERDPATGLRRIVPCKFAAVAISELEKLGLHGIGERGTTVANKYQAATRAGRLRITFDTAMDANSKNLATIRDDGRFEGELVFTTQISDSAKPKGKKRDFVFYDTRDTGAAIEVRPEEWRDFLELHDSEDRKRPWPGYWKAKFERGERVAVFWLPADDRTPLRFGLARMFRLAGRHSIHDAVRSVSPAHLDGGPADLASLLFGHLDDNGAGLRGRVMMPPLLAEGSPQSERCASTVLNSPKPSFFPAYLQQSAAAPGYAIKQGQSYTTWDGGSSGSEPVRIRGWKRYPARAKATVAPAPPTSGRKSQVILHPLQAGARFTGRIVFHNLRPAELGALAWAIDWGGRSKLRHGLGMGKPFGFGQVRLKITASQLVANDPSAAAPALELCRDAFVECIENAFRTATKQPAWAESAEIKHLLAMADPRFDGFPHELRALRLDQGEFQQVKNSGGVLPPYIGEGDFAGSLSPVADAPRAAPPDGRMQKHAAARLQRG